LALYLVFVLLTWFAMPLFNLLLRLSRFGRHALSRDMRVASNWFAACLLVFAAAGVVYLATKRDSAFFTAITAVGVALPLTTTYLCTAGWPRRMMAWFTAGLSLVGISTIASSVYEELVLRDSPLDDMSLFNIFLLGVLVSPWAANYFVTATARR
jgi:hypothetical protein